MNTATNIFKQHFNINSSQELLLYIHKVPSDNIVYI